MNIRVVVRAVFVLAMVACFPAAFGATVTYTAGGGTEFWSNPLNWSGNAVPGISDDVDIPSVGTGTVRIDMNATVHSIFVHGSAIVLIETGRFLSVSSSSVVDVGGTLLLNSSNFQGAGTLFIYGTVDIYGGTLDGPGPLIIPIGGLLQFWGTVNSSRLLRNAYNSGTINFLNTIMAGQHFGCGGAVIVNSGVIDIQTDHDVLADGGTPVLTNNSGGVIKKSFGSGSAAINFTVDNAAGGTIQSQSGTLTLNNGGTISGTHSISSGAFIALTGGTFTIAGSPTANGGGTLSIAGATVNIGDGPGGSSPDSWTSSTPMTFTSGTVALRDANLSTSSTFSVSATLEHYGGSLVGSGTMTINSGGVVQCHGTDNHSNIAINTTVNSGGQIIYTNDINIANQYGLFNNITVTNNGTIDLRTDRNLVILAPPGDTSKITNGTGTITKSAGSGITTISIPVDSNSGSTIHADTGTLTFSKGGTFSGITISGAGTVALPNGHFINGTTTLSGTLELTGNAGVSGTLNAAGTLLLDNLVDVTWPNVNLTAASSKIDGAGTLRVSGNFNWTGGRVAGSGPRVMNSSSTPTITCSSICTLDTAALQLQASTTYNAGNNSFDLTNGASITIDPGKTLTITGDGDFGGVGGGSIINNGTIRKNGTTGISILDVPVTMSGTSTLTINTGTVMFTRGASVAAGTTLDAGAGTTLEVNGGAFLFNSGPVSTPGTGGFLVASGTLRVPTSVSIVLKNVTLQAPGIIDGGGTLILFGTTTWSGGTMGSATAPGGVTQINSGVDILNIAAGGAQTLTQSRELINNGTLNYAGTTSNALTMSANAKITNNNAFNLTADGNINLSAGALIDNNGTITKSGGTGTSTISPPLDNHSGATLSAPMGTIALSGGGIAAGAFSIIFPAILRLAGGTFTVASTATVTGTGTLDISGATLDAGSGVNLICPNVALQSGGTITGAGDVRVSGAFLWSAGTIAGSGARVLTSTSMSTISCSAGNCLLDGAALQLQATSNFTASSNPLVLSNGASLTIDPGKTLSVTNDGDFTDGGGAASSIISNGTIWKKTTSGTSTIGVPVTISGTSTIDLDSGTLQFGGGASVAAGATLDIAPSTTLEVTGGVFLINSGSVSMPGSGNFTVSGGALRVPTSITMTIPNVTIQGGGAVIDGGGTLILSGTTFWNGGTMGSASAPGGVTRIDPGNNMYIGGVVAKSLTQTRQLLNNGMMIYTNAGTGALTMSGGSRITNNNAFALSIDGNINLSGTAVIENFGVITKNAGTGTTTLFPTVENNSGGTVNAGIGTLDLAGGGTHSGGSFSAMTPGTLAFSAGTHSMTGGGSISGTGALSFNGATATVGIPINVATLSITSGTATLDATGSADAFTMSGGTLGGSGTLTLNNGGTWSGGTMSGSGTTINPATKTLGISAPVTLTSRTLQNGGTLNVSGDVTGSGTINNQGTLNANASIAIGAMLNNSGLVETSNTLTLSGGGTSNGGSFTVTAPGNLSFPSGTHTMSGGGSISGTGTLTFGGAAATVGIPVNVSTLNMNAGTAMLNGNGSAGAFTMTGGTLGGSGTFTLTNGGTWSGGTMSGSGTTINPATKSLGISAPVTLNSTLQNDGTLNVNGNVAGSGTIANNGTLNTGANVTISPAVNNGGQVATSNALALSGGGTHSGSFTVTSPGNLSFTGGTHSVIGGGSIGGTGTLTFSGATATVSVPVNVGTLSVSGGTATLNASSSAGAFTMNGGTLGGSGTLTLTNGGTWSGGTMSGSGITANPAAMTFSIPGSVTLTGRTLQNNGTLNVSGAVIAGSGTIDNIGAVNDTVGATISAPMNNSGQVTTSALLSLGGGGTHSGTFTASNAASVIDFNGGGHTISGPFAGAGKFRFSGGTAALNNAWSGKLIDVAGGSVALNTSGTLAPLSLSGGTLTGSGNVTVSGPSTWSGGTIAGSGALTFGASATVTMPGTNAATLARPLLNQGTINFTASSSAMLIDGVAITNSGTFDIQSAQNILVTPGTPPFINNGTLRKSAGAGVMQFAAPLANTSLVQVSAGTLNFGGTYTQSAGTTEVLPGATLQTVTLSLNGGSLAGNGTIAGTVDNHATVAPGASPGTLTISGDYVQESDGVLNIQLGGTTAGTQYDRLLVSGNVTLGGTLNVTTINSFVPAAGNTFQILTFGDRPNSTTFALIDGVDFGSGAMLIPTYSATDLQLIDTSVQADLAVSVSTPPSVANGSAFAYTVNLINQGGSDATAVSFNATLPPNVTFNSASPAICSGAPNLVCTLGALTNLSSAVVVLNVTANGAGAAPITVFAGGHEFDPNSANNSASVSPSITVSSDLRIAVTGPPGTVPGSRAIYTITVTNSGPDVANNVAVSVAPSSGLTFNANSGACAGSFPCTISALSSGQSATINSAWDISPTATGSVQLSVNAASSTADPNSSNNSASATTLIGTCPAIVIEAPSELRTGARAEATATAFGGAVYHWSISNGTIDSGDGTNIITFTAGDEGPATLAVNVTSGGCTLNAISSIKVTPRQTCEGTAEPSVPPDGTTTAGAVVTFIWSTVDGASGYRLWLQQGDAPPQSLGRTLDGSVTKVIPPGPHHWYVETLFDGCASHESKHLALTILPATDCATDEAPQLSAPANATASTSASVAFSWEAVAKAIGYELWLVPAGGTPTLIHAAPETSYTATVPPGPLEWYVRAIFGGCAATESAHRTFTYTPPPECTTQSPLLIAPAEGERLTSPLSFEWRSVPGATSYELYVDGVLKVTTTSPHAGGIALPLDERRWRVRARLAEGCGALDSVESSVVVIPALPSCTPLEPPAVTAPAQISSGVPGRIQWTFVGGATDYVIEISRDAQFSPGVTTTSTVTTRQLPFTLTNDGSVPAARYIRVHAVDTKCIPPGKGPFSPVSVVSVLPPNGSEGVALMSDPTDVPYTLSIGAELAGLSFTAVPTTSWITVTPASGVVPPGGLTLHAFAHTAGLPPGASTGRVVVTTAGAAGKVGTRGDPSTSTSITLNNLNGTTTQANSTPPPDALTIPAVANVQNFLVKFQSDVCITNTSAQEIEYEISFIPSGESGITKGLSFNTTIASGATLALNSIVKTWLDGLTSSGTLQIRPLTQIDTPAPSAPATGLAPRTTFASSRTFSVATTGGTFGQYVPVVPYANYVSSGKVISLQQIAQSDKFRTNLGLVEGSGEEVTIQVSIFDEAGTKLAGFNEDLTGGQYSQLNEVLKKHGIIALDDGRIEVKVVKGDGKITAYASVIGNDINNDALLVPPATIGGAGHSKWVVPSVTDRTGGSDNWHTDVRIFNSGKDEAALTLVFYPANGGTETIRTTTLAPGEVRQLNSVLPSVFGISQDTGALHVSSAAPAQLVVTARTYNNTGKATYGEFIPAVTLEETVSAGSRPLQILQVEESETYHSHIGFAEVSGKEVTLEVSVFLADLKAPALKPLEVKLAPNQFLQIDSLLFSKFGLTDTRNARISVSVKSGEGRATAYLSLVDKKSGDPTYIPAQ